MAPKALFPKPKPGLKNVTELSESVLNDLCGANDVKANPGPCKLDLSHEAFELVGVPGLDVVGEDTIVEVDLGNNKLKTLDAFARFGKLTVIKAPRNVIGAFGPSLCGLQLTELDLSKNKLTSFPDVTAMSGTLKKLNVSGNQITGSWSCVFPAAKSLQVFNAKQNNLSWNHDSFLTELEAINGAESLVDVDLSWNPFVALVSDYRLWMVGCAGPLLKKLDGKAVTSAEQSEKKDLLSDAPKKQALDLRAPTIAPPQAKSAAGAATGEAAALQDAAQHLESEVASEMIKREKAKANAKIKETERGKTQKKVDGLQAELDEVNEEVRSMKKELGICDDDAAEADKKGMSYLEEKAKLAQVNAQVEDIEALINSQNLERQALEKMQADTAERMKELQHAMDNEDEFNRQMAEDEVKAATDAAFWRLQSETNKQGCDAKQALLEEKSALLSRYKKQARALGREYAQSAALKAEAEAAEKKLAGMKAQLGEEVAQAESAIRDAEAEWTPKVQADKDKEAALIAAVTQLKEDEARTIQETSDFRKREFKLVRERAEKIPLEAAKRAEVADTRARYDATLAAWRRRENNADKTLSLTGEPAAEGAPAGEECVTEEALKWLAAGWAKAVKAVLEEQLAVQDTTRQAKRQQQKERDAEEQVVLLKEDKMDEVMQDAFESFVNELRKLAGTAVDGVNNLWKKKCGEVQVLIDRWREDVEERQVKLGLPSPYTEQLELKKAKLDQELLDAREILDGKMKLKAHANEIADMGEGTLSTHLADLKSSVAVLESKTSAKTARQEEAVGKWREESASWQPQAEWLDAERKRVDADVLRLQSEGASDAEKGVLEDIESADAEMAKLKSLSGDAKQRVQADIELQEEREARAFSSMDAAKAKLASLRSQTGSDGDKAGGALEAKAAEILDRHQKRTEMMVSEKKRLGAAYKEEQRERKAAYTEEHEAKAAQLQSLLEDKCAPFQRQLDDVVSKANKNLDDCARVHAQQMTELATEAAEYKAKAEGDQRKAFVQREEACMDEVATEQTEIRSLRQRLVDVTAALDKKEAEMRAVVLDATSKADKELGVSTKVDAAVASRARSAEAEVANIDGDLRLEEGKQRVSATALADVTMEESMLAAQKEELDATLAISEATAKKLREQIAGFGASFD